MTVPNSTLRAVRMGMLLSQDDFARALQEAGRRAGVPNDANKRLVQRWESGAITQPRPVYARALEVVTGLPITSLGFASIPHDGEGAQTEHALPSPAARAASPHAQAHANYSGVWLSRYEFVSSGRSDTTFVGQHYVVLLQHGNLLTARSLPQSSKSALAIDLSIDGNVVTGTWTEHTDPTGYYRGARYHGAIQMMVEPTGRRMTGKWVGFGKDMDINTGPWELVFQDASTNKATLETYNRPVEEA